MSFKNKIKQYFTSRSEGFRPYYDHENQFSRIAFIHIVGAFIIAPIFTYAMYRSDAPEIYITLGIYYTAIFPVFLFICWIWKYMRDKLVYLVILQVFVSIFFAFGSLEEYEFSSLSVFYFFALYAITSVVIQRLYPAILYHVFVSILLLNSHEQLDNSEVSPFIVIGLFLVMGIVSTFVIYVRRQLTNTIEDYSEYLNSIMNNPGSGYFLIDVSKTLKVLDYNDEALRVMDFDKEDVNNSFFNKLLRYL